eukprot:2692355-Rhodomonas_salina.1
MDEMRQLIVILLLVITANVGPLMIIWVSAGVYLGTCNRRGRVSQHHINKNYFPSTPDPPANFKQVYKFKAQDQCVQFKARLYALANVCRISSQILVAAGRSSDDRIYVDSGCAISIFKTHEMMVNLWKIKPIVVQGITGERTIDMAGDLQLPAVSNDGIARTIIFNGVLFDPESQVNLLSADQLRQLGFSVRLEPDNDQCCIVLNPHNDPILFPLRCENKIFSIYSLTLPQCTTPVNSEHTQKSMAMFAGNMSLEELTHLRMSHANDEKLVEQSK